MADSLALTRSFYAWVLKTSRVLPGKKLIPETLSTDVSVMKTVSSKIEETLKGTEHHQRAKYWRDLFEGLGE